MASVGILQHSSAGRYFPFVVLTFKPGSDQNGISTASILLAVQFFLSKPNLHIDFAETCWIFILLIVRNEMNKYNNK